MARGTFSLSNVQVSGRVGDLVFLPQKNGRFIVRRMPSRLPRRTLGQKAASSRMTRAAAAWRTLGFAEAEQWDAYAATVGRKAYNAFIGLAAKRLQVLPDAPIPSLPPTTPFQGDGIVVAVQASLPAKTDVAVEASRSAGTEARTTFEPGLTFSADAPNAPGVVTELLLQRLRGSLRKPVAKSYVSKGFVAFAPGTREATVPVPPGVYACAVRFIRVASGQEAAILPLGKVVVPTEEI